MGGRPVQVKLIRYLESHPGVTLVPGDVAAELGETAARIGSAINHLIARDQFQGLTRIARGVFVYRPPTAEQLAAKQASNHKPAGPVMYELVGHTESIGDIVRDENGCLYKIERM